MSHYFKSSSPLNRISLTSTTPFLVLHTRFWPLLVSLRLRSAPVLFILWVNLYVSLPQLLFRLIITTALAFIWWRDVVRESLIGLHTSKLDLSFRLGVLFFICSEVFFFVSFFWAFYDGSLSPSVELGLIWPPKLILPLGVYSVPLLNTSILLSSGVSVTWAHNSIVSSNILSSLVSLATTVALGIYFLLMQYLEYIEASFSMSDGIFGSIFFISTGFHGFHVLVGILILLYSLLHLCLNLFTPSHHFIFEASAWYWHFVDVVWLFLYINVYWWGSLS